MPYKFLVIFISIICYSYEFGFSQNDPPTALTIEKTEVPVSDYFQFVKQNDAGKIKSNKENSKEFIEYQLKLYKARQMACDLAYKYTADIEQFRNSLAENYIAFNRLDEKMVKEYYSRILKEIDISHIQISIEGDLYKDTLMAYRKIDSISQLIRAGEDFGVLASKYSDAPNSADGGHIGYISGMQINFPLEELAFTTPVGEVSRIFRTSNSYHLIKVHQAKDSRGFVRVNRIFKKAGNDFPEAHNKRVLHESDSIINLLNEGVDFDSISRSYSDIKVEEGMESEGIWLRNRGLMEDIVDAAFELKYDGEISSVIISDDGFHLLKRLEYKPVPTLAEAKTHIVEFYTESSTRNNYLQDKFLRKVINIYGFTFNSEAYDRFVKYGKNSLQKGKWIEPSDLDSEQVIFIIGDQEVSFLDFSLYLGKQKFAYSIVNYPPVIGKHFQDFFLEKLRSYHKSHLEETYSEFKLAMQNYSNALLINCIEDEIWKLATQDSSGLKKYYNKNKNRYFVNGFEGLIITFKDVKSKQLLEFEINNSSMELYDLADDLQKRHSDISHVESVFIRKGENKIVDYFIWKSARFEPEFTLVMTKGNLSKLPADSFEEAFSDVLIDYQKVFKEKWLKDLRKEYSVKFDRGGS